LKKGKKETENHGGNRKPTRRKIIIIENGEFEFIGFVLLSLIVFSLSLSLLYVCSEGGLAGGGKLGKWMPC
jgi:hypothetical protein